MWAVMEILMKDTTQWAIASPRPQPFRSLWPKKVSAAPKTRQLWPGPCFQGKMPMSRLPALGPRVGAPLAAQVLV